MPLPMAVAAVVEVEAVELALVQLARERDTGWEQASVMAPAAVAVTVAEILTPVHTDRFTRRGGARECFGFIGFEGAQRSGLAAGLAAGHLIGSSNARSSLVGMCGGTRRTRAISTGLTVLGG
jgi:hypothetical protein